MPMKPAPANQPNAVDMKTLPQGAALTIVSTRTVTPKKGFNAGQQRTIAVAADGTHYWVPPHVVAQADGTLVGSYTVDHIVARGKNTIALRNA